MQRSSMRRSLVLMLFLLAGCSDDGGTKDSLLYPDLGQLKDLGQTEKCQSEWRDAVGAQTKVSSGAVTTTDLGGGVKQTVVDASAGGSSAAKSNPFVYVSLTSGARVALDDFAARKVTTWDLAFRRPVIRVNGGDSGPGQGAVAVLSNTAFDSVTSVPAASSFKTDDFLDDKCVVKNDPIGNIWTAFGGSTGLWYDYDTQTSKITPKAATYVVRTATGNHVKLAIDSWYDTAGTSAQYTLRWKAIP